MIEVVFHPETEHDFDSIDATFPGFKQELLESFTDYIASGREVAPDCFGNDAPYTQPWCTCKASWKKTIIVCLPFSTPTPISEQATIARSPERRHGRRSAFLASNNRHEGHTAAQGQSQSGNQHQTHQCISFFGSSSLSARA